MNERLLDLLSQLKRMVDLAQTNLLDVDKQVKNIINADNQRELTDTVQTIFNGGLGIWLGAIGLLAGLVVSHRLSLDSPGRRLTAFGAVVVPLFCLVMFAATPWSGTTGLNCGFGLPGPESRVPCHCHLPNAGQLGLYSVAVIDPSRIDASRIDASQIDVSRMPRPVVFPIQPAST